MTKNQKMLLGVGAVAVVGYLLWKRQQTSFTGTANRFATVGSRQKYNASGSKIAPEGLCSGKRRCPDCISSCFFDTRSLSCVCSTGKKYTSGGSTFEQIKHCSDCSLATPLKV